MDWDKSVVRVAMQCAGDTPGMMLQFLLQRLETCPDALPAIADAIDDMGRYHHGHAGLLRKEIQRRNGGAEVVALDPEGGAA